MKLRQLIVSLGLLALAGAAAAHHSFAAFDLTRTVPLQGTLTKVRLTHPHSWFEVEVADASGKPVVWAIEGLSPNQLIERGLKRSALKAGDKVSLTVNPLRSGEVGGSLVTLTLADGTVINGGPGQ